MAGEWAKGMTHKISVEERCTQGRGRGGVVKELEQIRAKPRTYQELKRLLGIRESDLENRDGVGGWHTEKDRGWRANEFILTNSY